MKSSGRDHAEGTLDRIAGRVLEFWGSLTGRRSTRVKGRLARGRGAVRRRKGAAKRGLRGR